MKNIIILQKIPSLFRMGLLQLTLRSCKCPTEHAMLQRLPLSMAETLQPPHQPIRMAKSLEEAIL